MPGSVLRDVTLIYSIDFVGTLFNSPSDHYTTVTVTRPSLHSAPRSIHIMTTAIDPSVWYQTEIGTRLSPNMRYIFDKWSGLRDEELIAHLHRIVRPNPG